MFDRKSTEQVLAYLFVHPGGTFHLRELSRETGLSVSTVSVVVDELAGEGLVTVEEGVTKEVRAADTDRFRDLKRAYNLEQLASTGFIDALERMYRPDAIVLFGSYARGEDDERSDIDIAIVNGRDADMDTSGFADQLERSIAVHAVDLDGVGETFRLTLANGITLRGYLDV